MRKQSIWQVRILASVVGLTVLASAASGRSPSQTQLDFAMFGDPAIELPPVEIRFPKGLLPLWLAALESPEGDLKQQAQRTLAWAQARSLPGIEAAVGPLTKNLIEDHRLLVRLTAAQALVALDARPSAQALFDRSQADGLDMAQVAEPALGRWRFPPLIDVWRRRLRDDRVDRRRRLLAIHGLGEMRDEAAADDLLQIAISASEAADFRLAAAISLGQIRRSGLEAASRRLLTGQSPPGIVDRLVAVRLLRSHDSPQAQSLLVEMVADADSTVIAGALQRLFELEPQRIVPLAAPTLAKGDVNVRRLVAQALFACPSTENVSLLGGLLADPDPSLRDEVRKFLEKLAASPDWQPDVVRQGERMISDTRWTALEQAVVLLAALDVKSASDRLLELLQHSRPEVYVAAAWGLRRLGVDQSLAPALEAARQRNGRRQELLLFQSGQPDLDHQLAHLFELFGQKKYQPAEPFLRSFIAKDLTIPQARSAAIWALGYLHENEPDAELVGALQERMRDTAMPMPEHGLVRRFSAITLGRMKAADALPTLEMFGEPGGSQSALGYACAWSIQRITGKPIPRASSAIKYYTDFFLEPREDESR
jgi:HEAT repeat protein